MRLPISTPELSPRIPLARRQFMAGAMLPSLAADQEYLAPRQGLLLRPAKSLSSLMVKNGLLKREDPLDNFMAPSWLPGNEAR